MKLSKKFLVFLLPMFFLVLICGTSCKSSKTVVKIKSLQANKVIEEKEEEQTRKEVKKVLNKNGEQVNKKQTLDLSKQYIVMYKNDETLKFTITLDNPKGEAIDAIELTCDDPASQILVDDAWKPIQYQNNSRILNWAQEDPYQKTYYIRTTSEADINTIRVVDIKVNGKWLEKDLENNELKIYKMNENDLKWEFITNNPTGYYWKFNKSENIKNLTVYENGNKITQNESGEYCVKGDCTVKWVYEYQHDDVVAEWSETREIRVMKEEMLLQEAGDLLYQREDDFKLCLSDESINSLINITSISRNDIFEIELIIADDILHVDKRYSVEIHFIKNDKRVYTKKEIMAARIKFAGSFYYIDEKNEKLILIKE